MLGVAVLLRRYARPLKILIQLAVLFTILGAVGTVGFVEYSGQPSFCLGCHIMRPYYDSWASSSHNEVSCIQCHYAPGIRAEAMGKFQAANQVVKYVTGTYGTKPWAEIEDASCLRSGCHVERKLEGIVSYRGVPFDHGTHLGELRGGKQLMCTSCHSQVVRGEHMAVTESTCYLCHFKGRPSEEPVAGCIECHTTPARSTSSSGMVIDHPQYVEDRVSCISCHDQVTAGSGAAEQARCFTCHNEPDVIAQFADTALIHRVHITEESVECTQCHVPIEHRVVSIATTFELDCAGCHQQVHDSQRKMYAGMGGHGAEDRPSAMFLASVSCKGCHELPAEVNGHEGVQIAGEASCLSCHGIQYANILPAWQREMDSKLAEVTALVNGAKSTLGSATVRGRTAADSLLGLAQDNVDFVRLGRASHNVLYADQLLRSTLQLVGDAVRVGRLPYTVPRVDFGPPVGENGCMQCHLGVERSESSFLGTSFDHESHVIAGTMSCSDCHTSLDEHGGTTITSLSTCDNCHHSVIQPMNCARCHSGAGGAPAESIALPEGNFAHEPHGSADIGCADCHEQTSMSAAEVRCEACHVEHHNPVLTCTDCHRTGAMEQHVRDDHVTCTQCHEAPADQVTRWTPQVCRSCHADLAEHYPLRSCEECHQIPPMGTPDSDGLGVYSNAHVTGSTRLKGVVGHEW